MDDLLYRGINHQQLEDLLSSNLLKPHGVKFSLGFTHNGDFSFDGSMTYGESAQNAVAMHQKDSGKYKTSGISTTPHLHRAIFYAGGKSNNGDGYILVFEKATLIRKGILLKTVAESVKFPQEAEDSEVIIHCEDNSPIGIACINSIRTVTGTIVWSNA